MKILILGGSQWLIPLIEVVNMMGHESFIVDVNPLCAARKIASHFIHADTSNQEKVLEIAKNYRINLVIAEQTDRFVMVAAYVNHILGLPGIHPDIALRFSNKLEMRRYLTNIVDMPAFKEINNLEEAVSFTYLFKYPLIIKPKSSQSSYGVFKIDCEEHLIEKFPKCLKYSNDGRVLIEQYINGPEITVEGLSIEGKYHLLAVSEKQHYNFNPCVAKRLSYPPRYDDYQMEVIKNTATKVVESLGLYTGISHAEYRILGNKPYLIEVAARGGGTKIASKIISHICQFNIYNILIRKLSGEYVEIPAIKEKAAVLLFLDFKPGKVRSVTGIDYILSKNIASEIVLNFEPGDEIYQPLDDTQRLGYAIVLGENRDDVDIRCNLIEELLKIEYE